MSWNPFTRSTGSKRSHAVITKTAEREFNREVKKLEELAETTKRLFKDTRRSVDASNALAKSEHKLSQGMLTSGIGQNEEEFHQNMEAWDRSHEKLERHSQDLSNTTNKTVIEPLKKFDSIFPSLQASVKRREQSLQECNKCWTKVEKYQSRDRTGPVVVKLEASRKASALAQDEFNSQNTVLAEDMPKLNDGRIDYFQPCLEALVKSQSHYYTEASKEYSELSSQMMGNKDLSDDDLKSRIQHTLSEIKALSITVD